MLSARLQAGSRFSAATHHAGHGTAMTTRASEHEATAVRQPERSARFSDYDAYLFKQGAHTRLHERLGAHLGPGDGAQGVHFSVWAPNAREVSVVGDFNQWRADAHPLTARNDHSGIWEGYVDAAAHGDCYKYRIASRYGGYVIDKSDPFAFCCE